jgi:hypothetical protein
MNLLLWMREKMHPLRFWWKTMPPEEKRQNVIAFATTAYAIVATFQWLAIREANKTAQGTLDHTIATARLDQRPWVFVVEVPLPVQLFADQPLTFHMKVANTGRTPAYLFETACSCIGDLPKAPEYSPKTDSMILPPGPSFNVTSVADRVFTEIEVTAIRNGETPLYCYGLYRYRDWWKEEHVTGYAIKYNHKTSGFDFFTDPKYTYAN